MRNLTDIQILNGLLANDEKVIQYVFYKNFNALLQYNYGKTAYTKGIDYEDVIQELYLYMSRNDWEKLRRYDAAMPFVNWFSVVSYRFFKNFSKSMIDSGNKIAIDNMDEKTIYIQNEQIERLVIKDIKAAISKLQPPRNALILKALLIDEFEPTEVAKQFNITVDNLYNIKRRALAKLVKELKIEN